MIHTHILGFPRMGARRELKFALERYWKQLIAADTLEVTGASLRQQHWNIQKQQGLDYITVGDFAFYDHVANHIQLLGCEPARFQFDAQESELDRYFTMARGSNTQHAEHETCSHSHQGHSALEMTKWFDTNYHYLVPEFSATTSFSLQSERLFNEITEAQSHNHPIKVVLLGPLSFLWLGKSKEENFSKLALLPLLIPVYQQLLSRLEKAGVQWLQLDEPILGTDLSDEWKNAFEPTYSQLNHTKLPILLSTYFSPLEENLRLATQLPVAGLHIDGVRAPQEIISAADWLPQHKVLSVGIVDGRNIWRSNLVQILDTLEPIYQKRHNNLWVAPSCSLLHVPFSIADETKLDPEIKSWLAGACEKIEELAIIKQGIDQGRQRISDSLIENQAIQVSRQTRAHKAIVQERLATLSQTSDQRQAPFKTRQSLQRKRFQLPLFPTTTIGSFPQTNEIRQSRAAFKAGHISHEEYTRHMKQEIAEAIQRQEALGIDVLVHGEAERNDMVEYFGEQLAGFAFTQWGWVQSYGSRCVKPPIIYGDVSRPTAMTVEWSRYAQSLTKRPVKGMLTGPITILQWSFVRDDQARSLTALQIALAIRDEVTDLERAGIGIIQIDEPAIREGLPIRKKEWAHYLNWATRAFRITASGVRNDTQIHTHMCYSEFNDILQHIANMDADVITIETSRSDMELLKGFGAFHYPNEIGPGVYDIHSPRIPSTKEIDHLLEKAIAVIPAEHLWVNPDCGLKTRNWEETEAALRNMMQATQALRQRYQKQNTPSFA